MPQSPISFKTVLLSTAASVIVNGAAVIIFLFNSPHLFVYSQRNNIVPVYIVESAHNRKAHKNIKLSKAAFFKKSNYLSLQTNFLPIKLKHKKKKAFLEHKKRTLLHKSSAIAARHYFRKRNINYKKHNVIPVQLKRNNDFTVCKIKRAANTGNNNTKGIVHAKKNTISRIVNISSHNFNAIFLWISRHKFYPTDALYNEEQGRAKVSFIIKQSGIITNVNLLKSSKHSSLDKAAVKIIKDSSPIPVNLLDSLNKFPAKAQIYISFRIE